MRHPHPTSAEEWPEADRLFRQDPRWLGSDDAYTVDLGGGRILWLFGDTFIGDGPASTRRTSAFIRNSIGIQQGQDPTKAQMFFHWGDDGGAPADFFHLDGCWLWPLHGALIDGSLVLFFMKVRNPSERNTTGSAIEEWMDADSLSFFEVFGWAAFIVTNPSADPGDWKIGRAAEGGGGDPDVVLGAGALVEDGWLYLWGWTQDRDGYLARCKASEAGAGGLSALEWWTGPGTWAPEPKKDVVALPTAQTEFTVYRHEPSGLLCQVQALGLSPAELVVRWATSPEGPWTEMEPFYRIPESERDGVIAYAGKFHPELIGSDFIVTYASNGESAEATLDDDSIYYPRFVRARIDDD